jgi:EAL domain-containing protein (putative c-di-GMP-specific phosphodiesterase class I)
MNTLKNVGCGGRCDDTARFPITMAFQPVVDIQNKKIYAYEALVRGLNGEGAAHVLSNVTSETIYAFDQACRVKAIELAANLGLQKRLNINFLPNAVYDPTACLQKTIHAAKEANFPTDLITFEFTENEQIIDREHLKNIIITYKDNGFITAIDDFGAGYSGLSLLADFQTDVIKIDREIIIEIHKSKARQAIVLGILKMAELLDIKVVCEGIETFDEYTFLKESGVQYMQGFLFAKPAIEYLAQDSEINWQE